MRVAEMGLPAWIEEQLTPETIADGGADWRVRRFDLLTMNANDLADLHLLLGAPRPAKSRNTLLEALHPASADDPENLPRVITAGLLASPAFQWR